MAMQPVQGNNAWHQFQRLAHNAKVRNAGFDLPLKPKKASFRAATNSAFRNRETVVHSMRRLYDIQTPQKQMPTVGTRFDAYA
jgi:hypothetical protein